MTQISTSRFKNLHLIVSILLLLVIAFIYGFYPNMIVPVLNDIKTESNDLKNVFKAIMGLYLSMTIFWFIGIKNAKFWYSATLINILFMLGLALGRVVSLIIDGLPDYSMLSAIALEAMMGVWGIISIKKFA